MKRRPFPTVFRLAAALLLAALIFGQWWQRQPLEPVGRGMMAVMAELCPAATARRAVSVADSARAVDRVASALVGNALSRDSRDRCRVGKKGEVPKRSPEVK
jgi:hypothetical protein